MHVAAAVHTGTWYIYDTSNVDRRTMYFKLCRITCHLCTKRDLGLCLIQASVKAITAAVVFILHASRLLGMYLLSNGSLLAAQINKIKNSKLVGSDRDWLLHVYSTTGVRSHSTVVLEPDKMHAWYGRHNLIASFMWVRGKEKGKTVSLYVLIYSSTSNP